MPILLKKVKSSLNNVSRHTLPLVLGLILVLSSAAGLFATGAQPPENAGAAVYYPLKGAVSKNGSFIKDFYESSDWSFQGKDFGSGATAFEAENESFAKPSAEIGEDGKSAVISWKSFENADKYSVNILNGNEFVSGCPYTSADTQITVSQLSANSEHFVQVTAYKDGQPIAYSQIGSFFTYNRSANEKMLIKGDAKNNTANFKGVKELSDGRTVLYYTDSKAGWANLIFGSGSNLTFGGDTKAFAFRFGQESLKSDGNKWLSPAFKPLIDTTNNDSYSGNNVTVYYVSDTGEVFESGNNGNTRFNSLKYPQFKSGWVIIPSALFKSSYFDDSGKHRFILTAEQLYEISYDSEKNTYTRSQKQVTFNDYNVYFSDFCAVKDLNLFLKSLTYSGSEFNGGVSMVYGHSVQSKNGFTLANAGNGTEYNFGYDDNGNVHTTLSYKLVSSQNHSYGMSLGFKAPESGVYDLTNLIRVENCKRNAVIYYRVIKEDKNTGDLPVWPVNGEWSSITCGADNGYSGEITPDCIKIELKAGEKLRLEAYAEFPDSPAGEATIRLCNTALVKTETSASGNESITEYSAAVYSDRFRNETAVSRGYYGNGKNRLNISAFDPSDSSIRYSFTKYTGSDGYFTEYENSGIGYYTDLSGSSAGIVSKTSAEYGIAFSYLLPKSGAAELSFDNPDGANGKFRILLNGKQAYPKSGWSEETGTVKQSLEVLAGDTVSLEHYADSNAPAEVRLGDVRLSVRESENTSNLPGTGYYSALWVRPFNGKAYNGSYEQSNGVWSFDLIDKNSQTVSGDMFSSALDGLVYNSSVGSGSGYIFKENEISLKLGESKNGASLRFKAPQTGYYDYGYIFGKIGGEGELRYRLIKCDTALTENGWEVFAAQSENVRLNGEIFLKADEILSLELFAESVVSPLEISLGAPVVISGVSVTPNADGNIASYSPDRFIRAENGYGGPVRLDGERFKLETVKNGTAYPLDTADFRERILYSSGSDTGVKLTGGGFYADLSSGGTLRITYNPVRFGETSITAAPSSDANFGFKLKKNGDSGEEILFDESGNSSYSVNNACSLKAGDSLVFEITGSQEIALDGITVNTAGVYPTQNTPESNIFIASLDYPYADEEYTGEYRDRDGIWSFGILNKADGKFSAETADYYDSSDGKHLYSREKLSGYWFKDKLLYADITSKAGISLGFKAPYGGKLEFSSGIGIINAAKADIYYRVVKNGDTVWPENGEWQKKAGAGKETDMQIPLLYLNLQENDRVSLQIYAEGISGGDVQLALNSPQFKLSSSEKISNSDFTASVYTPYSYTPYAALDFESGHTVTGHPVTGSAWNFEFIDLLSGGRVENNSPREIKATEYKHQLTNDIISFKNKHNNPNYMVYQDKIELRVFTSLDKQTDKRTETAGESLRFVSPGDCEALLLGAPSLSRDLNAGQKVYFRILLNGETVYPESGWEIIEGDKKYSDFKELKLELKKSDEIKYQFYTDADDEVLKTYSGKTCNEVIVFSPCIAVMDFVADSKTNFNFVNDMTGVNLQLSPFWRAQYTYDVDAPEWNDMETWRSGWRYWTAASDSYIGVSPTGAGEFWLSNSDFKNAVNPGAAALYTAQANGYIQFNKMTVKMLKTNMFPAARFRITQNGKTVYPEDGGWQRIDDDTSVQLDETLIAIEKGDKIRFEVSSAEALEKGQQIKIALNPKFIYSRYGAVYSKDKDIFGMLDKEMYQYFKGKASSEFDTSPEQSRKNSQGFLGKQEELESGWLAKLLRIFGSEYTGNNEQINETPGSDGYYIEGTPDKIIKRRKKITTLVSGGIPTYAVVLIAVGAAAVVCGGTVFLIVFIKKRKNRKVNDGL